MPRVIHSRAAKQLYSERWQWLAAFNNEFSVANRHRIAGTSPVLWR